MEINFKKFNYFPIIRTRQAEMSGYNHLSDDDKDELLPVITLGKWRNSDGYEKAIAKISECAGDRSCILDLTKDLQHQNESVKILMSPDGNFENWVKFVDENEFVIPTVQFTTGATSREIVQQAVALEAHGKQPVFRIKDFKNDLQNTLRSLYALRDPSKSLIVIDAAYIRDLSTNLIKPGVLESILNTINTIVAEVPEVPRVLAGTSFPRSVTSFLNKDSETAGKIDILENLLFDEIGSDIVMYGDHASVHSVVYDDVGGVFLPRIDVPCDGSWFFERRPRTKSEGYIDAAKKIIIGHSDILENTCWGAEMIRNTANQIASTINSPVTSISVRVNLHMHYQLKNTNTIANSIEDDDWLA